MDEQEHQKSARRKKVLDSRRLERKSEGKWRTNGGVVLAHTIKSNLRMGVGARTYLTKSSSNNKKSTKHDQSTSCKVVNENEQGNQAMRNNGRGGEVKGNHQKQEMKQCNYLNCALYFTKL